MFFGFQSNMMASESERVKGRAIEFWLERAGKTYRQDRNEAAKCIEEAQAVAGSLTNERDASRAIYWIAWAWVDFCGDIKKGASLINRQSISKSRRIDYWVHALKQLGSANESRVRKELLKIANETDELMDLLNIIDNWRDCFGKEYEDDLLSMMVDLTELSEDSIDLVSCAKQWQSLFDHEHDDVIRDCLVAAEAQTDEKDPSCFMEQAALWLHLGDNDKAREKMDLAETETAARDLPVLALGWHDIFHDDVSASRILMNAFVHSKTDKNVEDLWFCACSWRALETPDSAENAAKCLEAAMDIAATSHDWYCIGSGWFTLGNIAAAEKYAARAELLAKTAEDWCDCARLWQGFGTHKADEDRCWKEYHRLSEGAT